MVKKNKSDNRVSDTITAINVLKKQDKKIVYWVERQKGLGVRVSPKGKKTFIFRYKFEGKPRLVTLGVFNEAFGLGAAHAKHSALKAQVENGIDVWAEIKDEKIKRRSSPTVAEFSRIFVTKYCVGKDSDSPNLKSWREYERILKTDVVPIIGHHKLVDVKRQHVVHVINRVGDRAPVQANRTLNVIKKMLQFAIDGKIDGHGIGDQILEINAARGVPWYGKEEPCERKLDHGEIQKLWAGLPDTAAGRAIRLLLLCGQRSSEVRLMTWAELDDNVWTIPGSRTKNGKTQVLPLPEQAMSIIKVQREVTGGSTYVFEGRRWGNKGGYGDFPMGSHTMLKRLKETLHAAGVEKASVHDLRRTFRSELSRLKVDVVVAEKLLNHKMPGVLGVYDRYGYIEEKAIALQKWADALETIVYPEKKQSNVIELPRRTA